MVDILSLTLEELTLEMSGLSEPDYRAKQIFEWLHKKKISDFNEITNISKQLREKIREKFCIKSLNTIKRLVSNIDDTVKYLYELDGADKTETVFMSHNHGNSLCVSTQSGCRMGCVFCASAVAGLSRNLSVSEMLLQVYETERDGKEINSIVLMGVGEPLDNFDNTLKFLEILQSGYGMSLRHVSLSTCGLADKIDLLGESRLGLTLSVSLHASNDADRDAIMPINRRYNIERLMRSCRGYFKATGRRISYEYALIDGVNDSEENALQLAGLLKKLPSGSYHVNIIPINEIKETAYKKSRRVSAFARCLADLGVNATVRRTLGGDINAACGQLRGII